MKNITRKIGWSVRQQVLLEMSLKVNTIVWDHISNQIGYQPQWQKQNGSQLLFQIICFFPRQIDIKPKDHIDTLIKDLVRETKHP